MAIVATRYHDFCAGHRVYGHESKCAHMHGHNYRVTFHIQPDESLDALGRVLDFSVIKTLLCEWVEANWDHKFLVFKEDPLVSLFEDANATGHVIVPFNPTAENMAQYLLEVVGPEQLRNHGCTLTKVILEETRKCAVEATL